MITRLFDQAKSSTSDFCGQFYNILSSEDYSPDIALFIDIKSTEGHYHKNFDEIYFVLSGAITLELYDPVSNEITTHILKENDLCVITKRIHHQIVSATFPNRLAVISMPNYNREDITTSNILTS